MDYKQLSTDWLSASVWDATVRDLYLCIKLCQEVKVLFEVGGQDGFDDQKAKPFELDVLKVNQEVVLGSRHEEVPR